LFKKIIRSLLILLLVCSTPKFLYASSIYTCQIEEIKYENEWVPIIQKEFQFKYHNNLLLLGPVNSNKSAFIIQKRTLSGDYLAKNQIGTLVSSGQSFFLKTNNNNSSIKAICAENYFSVL
jgi:hypothetical protein